MSHSDGLLHFLWEAPPKPLGPIHIWIHYLQQTHSQDKQPKMLIQYSSKTTPGRNNKTCLYFYGFSITTHLVPMGFHQAWVSSKQALGAWRRIQGCFMASCGARKNRGAGKNVGKHLSLVSIWRKWPVPILFNCLLLPPDQKVLLPATI